VFPAHKWAPAPERAYATPHRAARGPSRAETAELARLAGSGSTELAALVEVYSQHNGAELCLLQDGLNQREVAALTLLPIQQWEEATEPWRDGEIAEFMEGCELYRSGTWRVVAQLPSEDQSLVTFFGGVCRGEPLAGKMFCIGLDGLLGFEELLAPDFGAFIQEFTSNPAAVFERIGFCWYVKGKDGTYGDPIEGYVPDVRTHPHLTPWQTS
jgi:hypothetical protein